MLTREQLGIFNSEGFLVIKNFYDLNKDIEPIQFGIYNVIGLVIKRHSLAINRLPFSPHIFDSGYQDIIAHDRKIGAEIYDAVKQVPAFMRLVGSERHEMIIKEIRGSQCAGVVTGGYGIRIDNPNEERFSAPWHQDYLAHPKSIDGIVFWSPLIKITPELGPVEFCVGSHKEGPARGYARDGQNPEKTGAYGLRLENEEALLSKYRHEAPLSEPGDLVILDFLTLHASGKNTEQRSRWSMQMRMFNFEDPTGMKIGWRGSFTEGVELKTIFPELVAEEAIR